MGRTKRFHENLNLTLPAGAKARMDAVLEDGEDRLDLIRGAITKEITRREKARKKTKPDLSTAPHERYTKATGEGT